MAAEAGLAPGPAPSHRSHAPGGYLSMVDALRTLPLEAATWTRRKRKRAARKRSLVFSRELPGEACRCAAALYLGQAARFLDGSPPRAGQLGQHLSWRVVLVAVLLLSLWPCAQF